MNDRCRSNDRIASTGSAQLRCRGIAVAEMLIGAGICVVILGLLVAFMLMGRRGERVAERDAALESALVAQERLTGDLRRLVIEPGAGALGEAPDGTGVGFWSFEAGSASGTDLTVRPIAYRVGVHRGRPALLRSDGRREETVGFPHVTGARFVSVWSPAGPMLRITLTTKATGYSGHTSFAIRLALRRPPLARGLGFRPVASFDGDQPAPPRRS